LPEEFRSPPDHRRRRTANFRDKFCHPTPIREKQTKHRFTEGCKTLLTGVDNVAPDDTFDFPRPKIVEDFSTT
jgi:hypothetical protein